MSVSAALVTRASSSFVRMRAAVVALVVVVTCSACELRADVRIEAQPDGTGVVTVATGFDDEALARLGDPASRLRLDDLRQAGWAVSGPERRDDGFTWVQASKAFASVEEARLVVVEAVGDSAMVRDLDLVHSETDKADLYRMTGAVDLSRGLDAFADPGLADALGGDPFGGLLARVEAEEGRSVAEMVDVRVVASVGDQVQVLAPELGGPAQQIDVTKQVAKPTSVVVWIGLGTLVVAVLGAVLLVARRRFVAARY